MSSLGAVQSPTFGVSGPSGGWHHPEVGTLHGGGLARLASAWRGLWLPYGPGEGLRLRGSFVGRLSGPAFVGRLLCEP